MFLLDGNAPYRGPSGAFLSEERNDRCDFAQSHPVHRFVGRSFRHRAFVARDFPVGMEVQCGVKQQSVYLGQGSSSFTAFWNDTQDRFGFLQSAYLPFSAYQKTPPALCHATGSPRLRLLRQVRDLAALAGEAIPRSLTTRRIEPCCRCRVRSAFREVLLHCSLHGRFTCRRL